MGESFKVNIRALTQPEQKYTYFRSTQIAGQTGCIGHLRGDFGAGNEFFSSWFNYRNDLKTDEFKTELDGVINALREDKGLLHNRSDMAAFVKGYPDTAFMGNYCTEYGFRVDTEKHAWHSERIYRLRQLRS